MASTPESAEFNGSTFINFDVGVTRQVYNGKDNPPKDVEVTFGISVWNEKLHAAALGLRLGQGVQVVCELNNKPRQGKDGVEYDNLRLNPLAIVPGLLPAPRKEAQDRPQGGGYQQGGYQQGPQGAPQAQRPAPLPHETEDDIPF